MTTTNQSTGVIRSLSRSISATADTVAEAASFTNATIQLANKYITAELVQADENIRVSIEINHAENLHTLQTTLGMTKVQAEKLLA